MTVEQLYIHGRQHMSIKNYLFCISTVIGCLSCNGLSDEKAKRKYSISEIQDAQSILLEDIMVLNDLTQVTEGGKVIFKTGVSSQKFEICPLDTHKLYFYDGYLVSISRERNKKTNGIYIEFHDNGNLYFQGRYENDKPHGLFISYDSLGTPVELNCYYKGRELCNDSI